MMPHTILVVDDDKDNLELVLSYLEDVNQGYSIISAPNGKIACKLAENKHPDLILLDWMMPEMSGLETLKYLKSKDKTKDIPVLMVTAQSSSADLKTAMETGAVDYIRKPVDETELLARVKSAIQLYDNYKEIRKQNETIAIEKQKVEHFVKELEKRNDELREFTAVASHDLKEPLRKVIVMGDKLKETLGTKIDEQSKDYLDRIRASSKRMNQLIDDLLRYSKVTVEEAPAEQISLESVVQDVISDLEVSINEAGAKVNIDKLPMVKADKTQMQQLFQNLISNAVKFHKKGKSPQIKIKSNIVNKEFFEIVVEDNGIGFEEKLADKLFKPFQRLHSRSEYEGTGIGAAICHKIVQRHGGDISAKSKPGVGSTFTVILPVETKKSDSK